MKYFHLLLICVRPTVSCDRLVTLEIYSSFFHFMAVGSVLNPYSTLNTRNSGFPEYNDKHPGLSELCELGEADTNDGSNSVR